MYEKKKLLIYDKHKTRLSSDLKLYNWLILVCELLRCG